MINYNAHQESFACRYRHCNQCEVELDISRDKEVVCVLCGETFCTACIFIHQEYCPGI